MPFSFSGIDFFFRGKLGLRKKVRRKKEEEIIMSENKKQNKTYEKAHPEEKTEVRTEQSHKSENY